MRKLVLAVGLVLQMGSALIAGNAWAVSTVSLHWCANGFTTGSNPGRCIGGVTATAISPTPGEIVMLKIVLQGDSPEGIGGVFVSILFDTAELDFVSAREHGGLASNVGTDNQFAPLAPGVSADEGAGEITRFDTAPGPFTGCIGCTITLGSVVFQVTAPSDNDGPNDVRLTVLPNGIDAITSAYGGSSGGAFTTANFGNAEILPEPTTGLLVAGGLLGLGYAGRRSVG